jgi:5-methylcytosine-specific restriction endonuclease McrA
MINKEELLRHPNYLLAKYQLELRNLLADYQKINKLSNHLLANSMGISEMEINEILNGSFNGSFEDFIRIALKTGRVPRIEWVSSAEHVKLESEEFPSKGHRKSVSRTTTRTRNTKKRLATYTVTEIFDFLIANPLATTYIDKAGNKMKVRRARVFQAKGLACVSADCIVHNGQQIVGTYFALDRWPGGDLHLDLFGTNKQGTEVMLTIDHILPKSKGGADDISNYQTMCSPCNGKKADKLTPAQAALLKENPPTKESIPVVSYKEDIVTAAEVNGETQK